MNPVNRADSSRNQLERMEIREQILNVLCIQGLTVARHFIPAEADDIGNALVVRGQPAQREIFVLEDALERRPLFPARGIWFVAPIAL
jgi:hypothetical protein